MSIIIIMATTLSEVHNYSSQADKFTHASHTCACVLCLCKVLTYSGVLRAALMTCYRQLALGRQDRPQEVQIKLPKESFMARHWRLGDR